MTENTAAALFDALGADITQRYASGRILIAVDGPDADSSARFADAAAAALRDAGRVAERASAHADAYRPDEDYTALRATLAAFRAEEGDGYLIVDGRFLLRPEIRGAWHIKIWLEGDITLSEEAYSQQLKYVRDENPRTHADAIYDVTHPDEPKRVWGDSC
ncbi:hypothetical protein ACOKGD_05420 [Microbacterium phosphatis]|uniref:hypothetical protein n=1 Tax=Microbacterium phosphatis TaxID=3140248 RepID=UPI003140BD29